MYGVTEVKIMKFIKLVFDWYNTTSGKRIVIKLLKTQYCDPPPVNVPKWRPTNNVSMLSF